jgi:hypothetical protein
VVAYSKKVDSHARVTIDGTDVSNSFSQIQRDSVNALVPAGGFSVSGVAEQLLGERTQGFSGTAFHTEELSAICEPIHRNRTIVEMTYQPNGLVDATREIYVGNVYISEWSPQSSFGDVATMNFQATAADETGINATDFT